MLKSKRNILLGSFVLLIIVVIVLLKFFIFIPDAPPPPRTGCDNILSFEEGVTCCDNIKGPQVKYSVQEVKDWCYFQMINIPFCDLQSKAFEVELDKKEVLSSSIIQGYTSACMKIADNKLRQSCLKRLQTNLACRSSDASYCNEEDNFCVGVLSGNERECLKINNPHYQIRCFFAVVAGHQKNDEKICDMAKHIEGDAYSDEDFDMSLGRCYGRVSVAKKNSEICNRLNSSLARETCLEVNR